MKDDKVPPVEGLAEISRETRSMLDVHTSPFHRSEMIGQVEGGMGGGSTCKDTNKIPFNISTEGIIGRCLKRCFSSWE